MLIYRIKISCILFLLGGSLLAQTPAKNPMYLGLKTHATGYIIPHRDTLRDIASSIPRGLQLDISRFNISEQAWQNCNCYARTGFSLAWFNYGNPKQLGHSVNLLFFLEPYFNVNNKLQLTYRAGTGLTYLNRTHDPVDNPENLFYSAPISFTLLLSLQANYRLSDNWHLNTGVFYNHISNGGIKQPNLGMNYPTLTLGADYVLDPFIGRLPKYKKPAETDRSGKIYARLLSTVKTVGATDSIPEEVQKPVIGIEAGYLKPISTINAFSLGVELVSDGAWREENERKQTDYDHRSINLMLGHNFLLGRFTFSQQLGFYAYKEFPNVDTRVFQRYGLFYQTNSYLNLGFTLKSHVEVAEIIDVRLGVVF